MRKSMSTTTFPLIFVLVLAGFSLLFQILVGVATPQAGALSLLASVRNRFPWYYLAILGGVYSKGILPRLIAYLNQDKPIGITWKFALVLLIVSIIVAFLIYWTVHERVVKALQEGTVKDWLLVASLYFQFGYFWEALIKDLGGPG